jgi:hypothetical protein
VTCKQIKKKGIMYYRWIEVDFSVNNLNLKQKKDLLILYQNKKLLKYPINKFIILLIFYIKMV